MSKRNYNNYHKAYDETKKDDTVMVGDYPVPAIEEEVVEETVVEEPAAVEEVPEIAVLGTVTCEKLNMRKQPSTNAEIICVLKEDEVVEIDSCDNKDFYKVTKGKLKGYCMKKFIEQL